MLGEFNSFVLPQVVGFKLTNKLSKITNATDLVLTVAKILREHGVVAKFVEFFGEGVQSLSLADRVTLSNMSPEYGSTMTYFPVDERTID